MDEQSFPAKSAICTIILTNQNAFERASELTSEAKYDVWMVETENGELFAKSCAEREIKLYWDTLSSLEIELLELLKSFKAVVG